MSFLNVMLLGGAAAFLAPLLIHLLNRSRFQSVDWGAMHLLEAAMQVNSRRVQWKSWLLLLLRCLIPIILAICLARPVLTSLRMAGTGGKKAVVMLLDNSLSMEAAMGEGTAFDSAKEEIQGIVAEYRSAELGLWTIGGRPVNALDGTTFDPVRVQRKLATLQPGAGSIELAASLTSALAQLNSMSNPSKQLVLLSDFQASEWGQFTDAELDAVRSLLETSGFPVSLSLMPVGRAAQTANLSIAIQDDDASTVLLQEPRTFVARVQNSGDEDRLNARVNFSVDGRDLSSRTISVPAGATQQVVFACEFTTAGWHSVEVSVDDPEGLAGDNRAAYVVSVNEPLPLLIVDPDGGSSIEDSSGYLQLALAPFEASGARNTYQIQVERGEQLRSKMLDGFAAIVLADVPKLNDVARQAIADFVRDGGGLIIFAGPRVDTRWYNSNWVDQASLLPMAYGEQRVAEQDRPNRVASQVIQTPLLNVFNSSDAGDLNSLEISRWLNLRSEDPAKKSDSPSAVLMRFTDGEPMLAGRAYGKGFVVQCCTSCSDDWSNLPLRPVYVPLMQRIVALAANNNSGDANIAAGDTLTLSSDPAVAESSQAVTIRGPRDTEVRWELSEQTTFAFGNTEFPGLYQVEFGPLDAADAQAISPPMFSVAPEPGESELGQLGDDELKRVAERLGASVVDSAGEFQRLDKQRSDGQEIWRWLLGLLVVFLFGEILLGQRITQEATS